jgi:hypothetical protein
LREREKFNKKVGQHRIITSNHMEIELSEDSF